MKIIYCDNEQSHLCSFKEEFSDIFCNDELILCSSPKDILNRSDNMPDIIFMDIDLEESRNGMDYAEDIFRICPRTKIIYVTAYTDKFIHDVFLKKANTIGFLMKPVQRKYLTELVEKARTASAEGVVGKLSVSWHNKITAIDENDIIYIESNRHVIHIITENQKLSSYEKLSDFAKKLSSAFATPHKSFIVNMNKISELDFSQVIFKNGERVPVSRSKTQKFKETYLEFLRQTIN